MTDKDDYGQTVMIYAAQGGSVEAMKLVFANGGQHEWRPVSLLF